MKEPMVGPYFFESLYPKPKELLYIMWHRPQVAKLHLFKFLNVSRGQSVEFIRIAIPPHQAAG
jgi:hypothetical protein